MTAQEIEPEKRVSKTIAGMMDTIARQLIANADLNFGNPEQQFVDVNLRLFADGALIMLDKKNDGQARQLSVTFCRAQGEVFYEQRNSGHWDFVQAAGAWEEVE